METKQANADANSKMADAALREASAVELKFQLEDKRLCESARLEDVRLFELGKLKDATEREKTGVRSE